MKTDVIKKKIMNSLEKIFDIKSGKDIVIALVETPIAMAGIYFIYCLMYVLIGG